MTDRHDDRGREFLEDPDFQKEFLSAPGLEWGEVELAFRHGFDSRARFADRPFDEVEGYLRESWEGMAPPAPWDRVRDIVCSGYERYKGAGFGPETDLGSDALDNFPETTVDGSHLAGRANRELRPVSGTPTEARPAGGNEPTPSGAPELPDGDLGTAGETADRAEA